MSPEPGPAASRSAAVAEALSRLRSRGGERTRFAETAGRIIEQLAPPGLFTRSEAEALVRGQVEEAARDVVLAAVLAASQSVQLGDRDLYRIKDDARRDMVRRGGRDRLAVRSGDRIEDSFERLFASVLASRALSPEDVERFGAEAALRVVRIVQLEELPSEARIQSIARSQRRAGGVRAAKGAIFVNRHRESGLLADFLRGSGEISERILQVHGPAGVGKTTLVRRALSLCFDDPTVLTVDLDFERPVTSQNLVAFTGREICLALFDAGYLDERKLTRLEQELSDIAEPDAMAALLRREAANFFASGRQLVLFLDSVEVFVNAFNDQLLLMSLVESLVDAADRVCAIIATRLSTFEFRVSVRNVELKSLTPGDVLDYCQRSGLDAVRSRIVTNNLPDNNPLLATLLIAALKKESSFALADLQRREPLSNLLFQRYVIDRIIAKLPDPLIREIARAAIPLRRLPAGLLFDSGIFTGVRDYYELSPGTLFDRLKSQVIFFETQDDEILLRPDIRRTLLQIGLASDQRQVFDALREKALAYFQGIAFANDDRFAATEALYYALCLNKERALLEHLWPMAVPGDLLRQIDDYSDRSRAWLKHKMGRRWTLPDFRRGFPEDVDVEVIGYALNAFHAGRSKDIEALIGTMPAALSSRVLGGAAQLFAEAVLELTEARLEAAVDKMARAALAATEEDMLHAILPMALRVSALTRHPSGDFLRLADAVASRLLANGSTGHWRGRYYRLWIARLTSSPGDLAREVDELRHRIVGKNGRFQVRVPLKSRELGELCLLASGVDPDFAYLWLRSINVRTIPSGCLKLVEAFLRALGPSYFAGSARRRLFDPGPSGGGMPARSIEQRQDTAVLLSSFLRHGYQRETSILDVAPLRTAMLLQSSEIVVGLLIAVLERTFEHATARDRSMIARLIDRPVSAEGRSASLIASAVRQVNRDGNLYEVAARLAEVPGQRQADLQRAIWNWTSFFRLEPPGVRGAPRFP